MKRSILIVATCCLGPTEVNVTLQTDACDLGQLEVRLGDSPIPIATPSGAGGPNCQPGKLRRIGNIVFVPGNNPSRRFTLSVDGAIGTGKGQNPTRCITARRNIGYVSHQPLLLSIDLTSDCADVRCMAGFRANVGTHHARRWIRCGGHEHGCIATVPHKGALSFVAGTNEIYFIAADGRLVTQPFTGVATTSADPVGDFAIAQDGTSVYVAASDGFRAVAKSTGTAKALVSPTQYFDGVTLLDGGWLYWVDASSIERVRIADGVRETFASEGPNTQVRALAADECGIYWTMVRHDNKDGTRTSFLRRQGK